MLYNKSSNNYQQLLANYDARKYPICAPHDGTKGLSFRRFSTDFLTSIATIDLKDANEIYDLSEALLGTDEGGQAIPPGLAGPIPMGGTAVAQRRFNKRKKLAYVHLYSHITDESLRKMLADEAFNDGEHAWQIMKRECDG